MFKLKIFPKRNLWERNRLDKGKEVLRNMDIRCKRSEDKFLKKEVFFIIFLLPLLGNGCASKNIISKKTFSQKTPLRKAKPFFAGNPSEILTTTKKQKKRNSSKQPLSKEESDAIGLIYDDTVFTASARTVNFNGSSLVPRFTYFQSTGVYDGNSRKSDPLDRKLRVYSSTFQGAYGVHEDVVLSLKIPFVAKELETTTIEGKRIRLNSEGIGDISFTGKWRFFKKPELGGTTELAGFLGLKLPSGRDDLRDNGMRLPPPLQPGSGSVDGVIGGAFTRLWDGGRWLLNADVFYKANSEANDYRFGNTLRFDIGGQYRVYPFHYESFDQLTLNTILELNGQYAEKDTFDGERIGTTGGLKLFLSPGLQAIVLENLLFEIGMQIPVYRHLNGPQLGEDFRGTIGLRWRF